MNMSGLVFLLALLCMCVLSECVLNLQIQKPCSSKPCYNFYKDKVKNFIQPK